MVQNNLRKQEVSIQIIKNAKIANTNNQYKYKYKNTKGTRYKRTREH